MKKYNEFLFEGKRSLIGSEIECIKAFGRVREGDICIVEDKISEYYIISNSDGHLIKVYYNALVENFKIKSINKDDDSQYEEGFDE